MGMRRLGEKRGKQHFFFLLNDNQIAICCWRGHHDFPEKWKNVELTRKESDVEIIADYDGRVDLKDPSVFGP